MSKIAAGEYVVTPEATSLADLIEQGVTVMEGTAERAGIRLQTEIPDVLPLVMADKQATKQTLVNLISNAIKFSPEDGRVTIRAEIIDNMAAVHVDDWGIGMEPEDISRALAPFVQVEREHNQYHQGTGLGLPLCKHFTELQGGVLTLKSERGKGTTATFTLPFAVEGVPSGNLSQSTGANTLPV